MKNINIIKFFSKRFAEVDKKQFQLKIQSDLAEENHELIQMKDNDEPYVDQYGRATFFTCNLADKQIPIYQPGTIMFDSAIMQF